MLEAGLVELASQEKEFSGFVDALMSKRREMQTAINDFERSRQTALGGATLHSGVGSPVAAKLHAAQSAFDRTYQRQTGLDAVGRGATLEQATKLKELGDLVRENKINERLAALKAK